MQKPNLREKISIKEAPKNKQTHQHATAPASNQSAKRLGKGKGERSSIAAVVNECMLFVHVFLMHRNCDLDIHSLHGLRQPNQPKAGLSRWLPLCGDLRVIPCPKQRLKLPRGTAQYDAAHWNKRSILDGHSKEGIFLRKLQRYLKLLPLGLRLGPNDSVSG